ncbi:MAG: TonB-dependent receptor [Gemmatimonadaceae bacterium]
MRVKLQNTIAAAFLLAVAFATAAAQQQSDTAKVAPVVVTATRIPISSTSSPATVSVITGDELRLRGAMSIAAALQMVPGVVFAQSGSTGGATSLFLRGGESKYVKVLVDGVSVNDPGGAIDFGALTTDNVERIEIVRGPASVLYGADAVTGVIQIFTRRGSGDARAIVSARGGSFGTSDEDATVLGGLGTGGYSFSVARHDTKGIYAYNNAFANSVVSGEAHTLINATTDIRASLRYNDDVYHYPTNGGGTVVDTNAHSTQDRTTLSVELSHIFSQHIDAHLALTSEETSGGTNDMPDNAAASGLQSLDRTRRRGTDLRANFVLPGAAGVLSIATITAGVQAEQEDERNETQSVFGTFQSTSIFDASRRNAAYYLQSLSTLPDSVVVTLGGRRDDNERFGKFDTYRVGGSWRALPGLHLRASAGTAFREPTFLENYSTGYVTGNENLSPERSVTWEAGAHQSLFADRVTVGATHFDQRFRNMIDYTGATTACGASYCNVARARALGNEFELQFAATNALSFDANLTHLETKVLQPGFDSTSGGLYHQGESLIRRPTTTWNLGGVYASIGGSLDLRVIHVGARTDRDFRPYPALPVVDPAYSRVDVGGSLPLASVWPDAKGAELTLHVENLFDKNYNSVFNFLSPRRTVLVGARASF